MPEKEPTQGPLVVSPRPKRPWNPFPRAVLRGLAIALPPVLTVVILLWVWQTVEDYCLTPVTSATRGVLAGALGDIREQILGAQMTGDPTVVVSQGVEYKRLRSGEYVPLEVYVEVSRGLGKEPQGSGADIYKDYVQFRYLKPYIVEPLFLLLFFAALYLAGRFVAAGIGRALIGLVERLVSRVPLVGNVYSSTRDVTNFLLNEQEMKFSRVAALEYPREGQWSIAFVTGEPLLELQSTTDEPLVSIMVPIEPIPAKGYTMIVRQRDLIDLNMTVDQACQFILSCGIVVPEHQLPPRMGLA